MTISKILSNTSDVKFSVEMTLEDARDVLQEYAHCRQIQGVKHVYAALRLLQKSIEDFSADAWQKS